MSKSSRARAKSSPPPAPAPPPADRAPDTHPNRPFTPRPLLLGVLSTVFAAWLAFLVYLYVTTVYPHRSVAPTTAVSAASRPGSTTLTDPGPERPASGGADGFHAG